MHQGHPDSFQVCSPFGGMATMTQSEPGQSLPGLGMLAMHYWLSVACSDQLVRMHSLCQQLFHICY